MKTKNFLKEYYSLENVHAYNTFVKSLPEPTLNSELAESIFALTQIRNPYEDLSKYVPGSESYNKIAEGRKAYADAQKELKDYKYSTEVLIDEYYPKTIRLDRHTITYKSMTYDIDYVWDGEEEHSVCSDEYEIELTEFFYTVNPIYSDIRIITDFNELLLPYERKNGYADTKDLIQEYIDNHDATQSILNIYQNCHRKGWDPNLFMQVFDYHTTTIYTTFMSSTVQVCDDVTGKKYYQHEVEKLMEEYKIAKTKKYIVEDRYLEYPMFKAYIRFLEELGSTYLEVPENSQ